jgi:Rhodopirellula transposase DDE domain
MFYLWGVSANRAAVEKKSESRPDLVLLLHQLIEQYKAGSPTQPNVYWISYKPKELGSLFFDLHGIKISNGFIKRELHALGYKYRKIAKNLATGCYAQRDTQFQIIFTLVLCMSIDSPVLSIDCKKKERLGTIYREGKSYCLGQKQAFDHDYSHLGEGKIVPHGIYDIQQNKGFVSIGNSSETAAFIIDNLRWYWLNFGLHQYPDAKNMLLLCDAGGGNSYRHHAFKKELLALAKEIGINIIVVHYPPYASKWNPIEHRLFAHIHQALQGEMFESYEQVKQLIQKTKTETGLTVVVRLNLKKYEIGNKTDKIISKDNRITYHPQIPELNYRILA